ncbi:hypothetical protein BTURTLESOX_853 [bacterium endosymbiont of Bathymodiolus sp. 5 South]|nr:hypothetical protein BTURTLESOX_853 [bacterium endosymbiont of Bathymodiolus sp. 5 South]
MALVLSFLPNTTYDLPAFSLPFILLSSLPTIKSSKPSPLTSPALEIEWEYSSFVNSPIIIKPPVPVAMADNSTASVSCLPNTTYDVSDVSRALIIKSSKPSPLISPALEAKWSLQKLADSPLIIKPPLPAAMADNSMASVPCLPNTTYDLPVTACTLLGSPP